MTDCVSRKPWTEPRIRWWLLEEVEGRSQEEDRRGVSPRDAFCGSVLCYWGSSLRKTSLG